MRSARLGNRLMAGVQYKAMFDASTSRSKFASPRPNRMTTLEFLALDAPERALQSGNLDEAETLRERKVLLQQPIPLERAQRHRQQGLAVSRSQRAGSTWRAGTRASASRPCREHERAEARRQAQLVQLVGDVIAPGDIASSGDRCAICENFTPAVVFRRMRMPPLIRFAIGSALSGRSGAIGEIARRHDLERPERHVVRRAELARRQRRRLP